jgi:hypothetical protein
MAFVKCNNCGKNVSDKLGYCPFCKNVELGNSYQQAIKHLAGYLVMALGMAFMVLMFHKFIFICISVIFMITGFLLMALGSPALGYNRVEILKAKSPYFWLGVLLIAVGVCLWRWTHGLPTIGYKP